MSLDILESLKSIIERVHSRGQFVSSGLESLDNESKLSDLSISGNDDLVNLLLLSQELFKELSVLSGVSFVLSLEGLDVSMELVSGLLVLLKIHNQKISLLLNLFENH